jgi:putative spermidine/putrescine transport system ATP-binding protein/spermidine/putrescine transport system ATP-binding protein
VYASPADRFVASFIGDANVIPGVVESIGDARATIRVGNARVSASRAHLADAVPGTPVDLLVRPEQITLAAPEAGDLLAGRVHASVFQGGHTDVLVDVGSEHKATVLVRLAGPAQANRRPAGSAVGLAFAVDTVLAFPRAG